MNSLSSPPSRTGRKREGPQFNRCVCSCVPSPEPRWTDRLHMAVASPTVVAFANFAVARHPQDHARWFLRGSGNEADRFTCVTARTIASPHQHGTFTVELSPGGSPQPGVDYDYAGKQPIPATGLAPARYTALWAADESPKRRNDEIHSGRKAAQPVADTRSLADIQGRRARAVVHRAGAGERAQVLGRRFARRVGVARAHPSRSGTGRVHCR